MKSTSKKTHPKPHLQIRQQPSINMPLKEKDKKTSRCLTSFSAQTRHYLELMQKLLNRLETGKVRKIMKEIKKSNAHFREYVNENRIVNLRIQDVIKCQDYLEREQNDFLGNSTLTHSNIGLNPNNSANTSRKNMVAQQIRHGFNCLLRKMQQYEVTDFEMQIRYCNSTVEREVEKLAQEYEGIGFIRNSYFHTAEIQQDERQNGRYELLRVNQIKKSAILENCEIKFRNTLFGK